MRPGRRAGRRAAGFEQLVQPRERNREVGRVGRIGLRGERGDDALHRLRLDAMEVEDAAGGSERRRRNIGAEYLTIGRDPHPGANVPLRLRHAPLCTQPWRRAKTDVG